MLVNTHMHHPGELVQGGHMLVNTRMHHPGELLVQGGHTMPVGAVRCGAVLAELEHRDES